MHRLLRTCKAAAQASNSFSLCLARQASPLSAPQQPCPTLGCSAYVSDAFSRSLIRFSTCMGVQTPGLLFSACPAFSAQTIQDLQTAPSLAAAAVRLAELHFTVQCKRLALRALVPWWLLPKAFGFAPCFRHLQGVQRLEPALPKARLSRRSAQSAPICPARPLGCMQHGRMDRQTRLPFYPLLLLSASLGRLGSLSAFYLALIVLLSHLLAFLET